MIAESSDVLLLIPRNYTLLDHDKFGAYVRRYNLYGDRLDRYLDTKGPVALEAIGLERNEDVPSYSEPEQPLVISGKLIKAILAKFAEKPIYADSHGVNSTIGVLPRSIAATDCRSAIIIGWPDWASLHDAVDRNSALLEGARSEIYGDACCLLELPRMVDKETGQVRPLPDITRIVGQTDVMQEVGSFNVEYLARIVAVCKAANTSTVTLLRDPKDETSMLGFQFDVLPEDGQFELFEFHDPIPAKGLVCGKVRKSKSEPAPESEEFADD